MPTKVVSFEYQPSKMSQSITASSYLRDILMDVESILNNCCADSSRNVCNIVPAICQPFDVDIAQNLFCGTHFNFNTTFQTSDHESSTTFHDIVWGSCCSYGGTLADRSIEDLALISEQLVRFANDHFQSSISVTAMSQLDLGCLALWLSWYPAFFLPNDIHKTSSIVDVDDESKWRWLSYKDNVVTGLLNVLGSQKHDPKCLSIAVACLSFIIQQHNASESVLTDANISQLLRLGLSKAVYPTLDNSALELNSSIVPPHWELIFCRIGIRRLLLIKQVLVSEGAINETFTFVSKWWDRLKGATVTPGNGYETPSKLMKNNTDTNIDIPSYSGTPVIPVVRSALDIVADLYILVPEIKSYVHHMVTSDSFLYFKSYILSVDPKTVISATNFVSNIISDFSTPDENGFSIIEIEKKLDLNDIKSFYNCAIERLLLYCELKENNVQVVKSDTCNEMNNSESVSATSKQCFTKNTFENKNGLNHKMNVIDKNDSRINEPASKNSFSDIIPISEKARSIVFTPLIRSLSTLINKCLITADALPLNELSYFYSFKHSILNSEEHNTLNDDAEVLMLSLKIAFLDLLTICSENNGSENGITNCELHRNANSHNLIKADIKKNINIDENKSFNNNDDGSRSLNIEEKDEIFDGFVWRKRQLILTILSSIYLFRSHANFLIENDMKESKHTHPSNSNSNASWLHNFDTSIATFFQSRIQTTIRSHNLLQKVFLSVLKQGMINENEFLDSMDTNEDNNNRDNHAAESTKFKEKRRLLSISRMFYNNIKNVLRSEQNVNVDNIIINVDDSSNINSNDINYHKMEVSDSNPGQMKIERNKVTSITNDNTKSNDNHDNYGNDMIINMNKNKNSSDVSKSDCYGDGDVDGQGSDESQSSCLLTLTCLGPSSSASIPKMSNIDTNTNTNTNNASNSTCENKLKCSANFNSPEKNVLICSSNQIGNKNGNEVENKDESKSNKDKDEIHDHANLSTAFTPAHSKSRQVIFDRDDDDGYDGEMLLSSNADHFTGNNQHDESFQNSESTIFNIEINHIDNHEIQNELDKNDENDLSHNGDIKCMKKNRFSDTNENKMNVIEDDMTINCAAMDSMKQLIASKRENMNMKQLEEDDGSLNLEVTNMSIEDCSRMISAVVADENVADVASTIMPQPLPLSVTVLLSHSKLPHTGPNGPPYVSQTNLIPHPASLSSSLPFSLKPSSSFSSSVHALTPVSVPVPPTLAVILTETKASANALRHTLSNVPTCSTYTPVCIQTAHLNSSAAATAASSSSSSSSPSNHHPLQQSVHLNGYTGSTVKDEVSVDMMDCMGRLKNVLQASDVTQLQLELISIREENVLLKKLRDASVIDRMSQQAVKSALHFELTGNKSKLENFEHENKLNVIEIENLKCLLDGTKITLLACEERKNEQENLLQESWVRLSHLAKKESATQLHNAQLINQAENASNRATAVASELVACKGSLQEKNSILQFLQAQIDEKEKRQQNFLIEKLNMEDTINEYKRKNELLKSKLKSYEIGWEKEMKISNEKNQKIVKLEIELKESKTLFSLSKIQNDTLIIENDDIKKEMQENKCSITKLEERALMSEEHSKEWEEKYNVLESTHEEHSSKQKEREESLLEQLEVNIRRGDNAENDLQKHKELMSFINKLSTEGEAGRAKARRLSEAVCHDNNNNLKSQNKENIYSNNNSNSNNKNNDSCNGKSNSNKSISDDYDDDKYDSRYEERSRKVRKPSRS